MKSSQTDRVERPTSDGDERSRAKSVAFFVRSESTNRAYQQFIGSILLNSPRFFHLVADELEGMKPLEPWEKERRGRRMTPTSEKVLWALVSLARRRNELPTMREWREHYKELNPGLPLPGESTFRFLAAEHGIELPRMPVGRPRKIRRSRRATTWPSVLQFSAVVRDAMSHGGTIHMFASIPSVTHFGLTYTAADNGRKILHKDLTCADIFFLMLEMNAAF